jgi:hypothetical protein
VQIIMCFGISLPDFVESIVPDESTDGWWTYFQKGNKN